MYLSRLVFNARNPRARGWLADCHALHSFIMSGFPSLPGNDAAREHFGVLFRVERMTEPPAINVLVQSQVVPRWEWDEDAILTCDPPRPLGPLLKQVADGQRYRFRLRANPTRRVHQRSTEGPLRELDASGEWRDPSLISAHERTGIVRGAQVESAGGGTARDVGKWIGKRVELRREEEQLAWLARQGAGDHSRAGHGFDLLTAGLLPAGREVTMTRADPGDTLKGKLRQPNPLTFGTVLFEGGLVVTNAELFRGALLHGIGPGKAFGCGLLSLPPLRSGDGGDP